MHTAKVSQATTIYVFTGQGLRYGSLLLHVWSGLPGRCCRVSRAADPNMCALEYHCPLSPKHLHWINPHTHQHATHKLVGTGSFTQCLQKTAPLLNKNAPCLAEPCLFDGMHVPPINTLYIYTGIHAGCMRLSIGLCTVLTYTMTSGVAVCTA